MVPLMLVLLRSAVPVALPVMFMASMAIGSQEMRLNWANSGPVMVPHMPRCALRVEFHLRFRGLVELLRYTRSRREP